MKGGYWVYRRGGCFPIVTVFQHLMIFRRFFYVGGNESISLVLTMRCKTWLDLAC